MAIMLIAVFLNQIEAPLQSLLISYRSGFDIAGFTPSFLLAILWTGWLWGLPAPCLLCSSAADRTHQPPRACFLKEVFGELCLKTVLALSLDEC